ncbi:MAG: alpha/beta fold hydrolase, partial [Planctomycetota bacterium]
MTHEERAPQHLEIEAADGQILKATLFAPAGTPKAALQINAGLGLKRRVYRHLAAYLAAHGYAVLTMDFRGVGDSRPRNLRGFRARLRDWGQLDLAAGLDWLARRYPDLPKLAVGHSIGGPLIGLMPNHGLLDGIVLLFAGEGNLSVLPFKIWT